MTVSADCPANIRLAMVRTNSWNPDDVPDAENEMNDLRETSVYCPYCGEQIDVTIEVMDDEQEYIEDCQVCCRPIIFNVGTGFDGNPSVTVRSEDETF